jgi:hypothetical protein
MLTSAMRRLLRGPLRPRRMLVHALAVVVVACTPDLPPRPPVELALQIATRQSCGILSGLDYDITCLSALHVRVLDENGNQRDENVHCVEVSPPRVELGELLRGEQIVRFGGLSTNATVSFEVRGLHNRAGSSAQELCENAANTDYWLFWGTSAPVDLTQFDSGDAGSTTITIFVDCRDCACEGEDCFGCAGINEDTCPAELPPSFCVPTSACNKACQSDDDCFGGARACDLSTGTCDTTTINGGLCSPCSDLAGCADGLSCVGRIGGPSFCAPSCPDTFCIGGTKCNRLGNNLERRD